MAAKVTSVRARIEPDLKKETEKILEELGLTTTEAIRLFFKQVKLQKGLPFALRLPNEETEKAIWETRDGQNLKKVKSSEDLFKDLVIFNP
ncbi:MAG: type II toxin-antitoxin system RelB/DinJ family antitoxin [Balneolales bacterium]